MENQKIKLGKLDAARNQLKTAIQLWFADGDPVSIHTLAFAAYEIIHVVSKKKNQYRQDLLFDSFVIKDEYRAEWNASIKAPANFFKHAKNDADKTIEFNTALSQLFIQFAIVGIETTGELFTDEEATFVYWLCFHEPKTLTEKGRKQYVEAFPVEDLASIRAIPKKNFFEACVAARRNRRAKAGI